MWEIVNDEHHNLSVPIIKVIEQTGIKMAGYVVRIWRDKKCKKKNGPNT
jgi:hypothetical protein